MITLYLAEDQSMFLDCIIKVTTPENVKKDLSVLAKMVFA
jgi:hypothetical protein